ncbi:MAG: molybdenum cofactor guanylyltransferase [Planctomycetota bacterium]|jgi:molybdopterin-guanine dinucleotide biosynthesis protein A
MLKIPGMLMVGSMGRGSGKTKFVCSLIDRFSSKHDIIGIKVTPVQKADGSCPRGGSGCGVCSSLEGHFYITEETDSRADKDTCRMLTAGASKVFWLRVLRKYLEEGVAALLDVIGDDAISVCESNSLRAIVEPDVFVMVRSRREQSSRVSAENVIHYADRIVLFNGDKFDIDVDEIELIDNRWISKMQATAVIMAGGGSIRMGQDKSMLPIDGQPMIKYIVDQLRPHFSQILISSNDVSRYNIAGAEVIPDEVAGRGPLGGIASALKASANELNFVIACDIPQVDIDLMKMLLRESRKFDAVIPRTGQSKYEPLFAVYKKSALKTIEEALLSGNNRIIDALGSSKVKYIDLNDVLQLKNLNTMDDYREFVGKKDDAGV